jgi:hypothetical protein
MVSLLWSRVNNEHDHKHLPSLRTIQYYSDMWEYNNVGVLFEHSSSSCAQPQLLQASILNEHEPISHVRPSQILTRSGGRLQSRQGWYRRQVCDESLYQS